MAHKYIYYLNYHTELQMIRKNIISEVILKNESEIADNSGRYLFLNLTKDNYINNKNVLTFSTFEKSMAWLNAYNELVDYESKLCGSDYESFDKPILISTQVIVNSEYVCNDKILSVENIKEKLNKIYNVVEDESILS